MTPTQTVPSIWKKTCCKGGKINHSKNACRSAPKEDRQGVKRADKHEIQQSGKEKLVELKMMRWISM